MRARASRPFHLNHVVHGTASIVQYSTVQYSIVTTARAPRYRYFYRAGLSEPHIKVIAPYAIAADYARGEQRYGEINSQLGECSTLWGERERGTVHGGRIRLLPPEINWAHRMLSQSSASSLLCWSCTHWLKCVASVISDVPLMGSHIEGGELGFN